MKISVLRLAQMGVMIALGVVASYASAIPLFGAKLFPAQAAIDVVAGAIIGPWLGAIVALCISLIRIAMGTGTPLAIPGSLFGVVLAGLLYRYTRAKIGAVIGEAVGTGIIGAVAAYPVAVFFLGNAKAAAAGMTFFIIPFASSSVVGAILGGVILAVLERFMAIRPATR